ncbi:MAG: urease subunit beta [Verrucomicrobiales bacterium]
MIPGEVIVGEGKLILSVGLATRTIRVANAGDRPIQVGSHFHFFEVNSALEFDREAALGFRLDVPSGSAVRFEPGDEREVNLVALAGDREVHGLNMLVNAKLGSVN